MDRLEKGARVILPFIVLLLFGIAAAVMSMDAIPICRDWLGRIYIGRFRDMGAWNESVTKIGMKWLNRTPKVKVTDNTRLVALDMLKGNYSRTIVQQWQQAALLLGLAGYVKKNQNQNARKAIDKYLKRTFDSNGQWRRRPEHIDAAILSYAILKLGDIVNIDHYKPAFDTIWELIQAHRGEDGTIQYRRAMKEYRYVDTIGFICPFLVAYGTRYNKNECVQLAITQLTEFERAGMHASAYIPCHAYKINQAMPFGLYGWGRGFGWFASGLIDSWVELPQHHAAKAVLEAMIKRTALSALSLQNEAGGWNWTLTRQETRPDSSATAMLGWFLLQASQINELHEPCAAGAARAVRYLMKATRRNGAVDFSQGETKDIGVYSMLFNLLPFTQGFSIRMMNAGHAAKVIKI